MVTPKFRHLTPFLCKECQECLLCLSFQREEQGGILSNCDFLREEKRKKARKRSREFSKPLAFRPTCVGTGGCIAPFLDWALQVSFSGETKKNGESKSKQSHLFKWATTSQWQRGFLIHSFPFFSLASVDSLSTQGKIKIAFALAQRDETDWCVWSVQPPPALSNCSEPCKVVINTPEQECKGHSMPWTCSIQRAGAGLMLNRSARELQLQWGEKDLG